MNIKVFVTHYSKLIDRKKHIDEQLKKHSIDAEFILDYDKEIISGTNDSIESSTVDSIKRKFNLSDSKISLFLKHIICYKKIVENYDYALILEDDVILDDNFCQKLNKYMSELPSDWDMFFLGDGCGLHIPQDEIKENQYIYKARTPSHAKCTDSYLVTKDCANKLLYYFNYVTKISSPIDWWLNISYSALSLKYYWCEPTIVTQGSQNGTFNSSLL